MAVKVLFGVRGPLPGLFLVWGEGQEGGRGWLVSAEQVLLVAPLGAAWPTASASRRSTGLSALLREPNDFILMGHDSTQGNR